MQTTESKVIIYDDVCPMCNAYTGCFLHLGWLKHRTGFAEASPELLRQIDLDRARHEIPLHDTVTGETVYGLDALFLILGGRFPMLRPLFRNRLFRAVLRQLYQIITYNRRVIAGSSSPASGFDCAPDVNLFYRWLYIGLALAGGTALFVGMDEPVGLSQVPMGALLVLHSGMLAVGLAAQKKLDFAGHWATMFLLSGLLVSILPAQPWTLAGVVALVAWMWGKRWRLVL